MLARELWPRPCSPGVALPRATMASLMRCSSFRPRLPRSSMMSLKPPVVPRPSTGGPPKVETMAVTKSGRGLGWKRQEPESIRPLRMWKFEARRWKR